MPGQLRAEHSRADGEPDFLTEWVGIKELAELKRRFPAVTTNACAKLPPKDLLVAAKYEPLVDFIRHVLKGHASIPFASAFPSKL